MGSATTVDDLSYAPLAEEWWGSGDAIQFVAKALQTLTKRGEAVWPPLLEAALLKALEMYPTEVVKSKSEQRFGQFPMRNRFISEYIYKTTGERRTSHQVARRLLRLRYTCKEEKNLQLLSHGRIDDASSSSQSESSVGAPDSPSAPDFVSVEEDHTYVKILLQDDLRPAPPPTIQLVSTNANHPQSIQLSPTPSPPSGTTPQNKSNINKSNILSYLSGAVEFPSSFALLSQSTFVVYAEGSTSPVHSGVASLRCISLPTQRSAWVYSVDLVPSFWESLCASRDVTRHTIVQTLEPAHPNPSNDFGGANRNMSVVYRFEASESRSQEISPVHDTSTTLAPDSTPLMPCDYSKETNHRCTVPTSTMIQGTEITIQGGKLTNVGGDYHNHTYVMKHSTKHSKYVKDLEDCIKGIEKLLASMNLGTLTSMGGIDEPLRGVGKDFQQHDPKKSTKTTSNTGEQATPSRRSRVETEDDLDDDELDTIANAPYDKPTEFKFSSLNDLPSTSASESATTPDNEYYIYQTPPPTNRQLLVFVPGILHYLPCWFWLPSLTGLGQWVASWTATWATPPCWMPSLI